MSECARIKATIKEVHAGSDGIRDGSMGERIHAKDGRYTDQTYSYSPNEDNSQV